MKRTVLTIAATALAATMFMPQPLAAQSKAPASTSTERFRYSWSLKGGLAWIASLRFPTSGYGELKTVRENGATPTVDTQLRITPKEGDGFYLYQSQIDSRNGKTLTTYHGYQWGDKQRTSRTFFDYVKRLARTRTETPQKVRNEVKPIPQDSIRDILTAIYFLRENSTTISGPQQSNIFSDGKFYPVLFEPAGRQSLTIKAHRYDTNVYRVSATPEGRKKWPGDVMVWLTRDESAVPVRIELQRNFATLRLDLDSVQQ